MQQTRFTVLTGHLNDYPLPDLFGILRHQRKTGRLLIEYPIGPGSFFFKDGNLVDAQLNTLSGWQAICVALSQPNASFNFNPLIEPSRHSIPGSSQRVIFELLGCWEESPLDIEASAKASNGSLASPTSVSALPGTHQEALPEAKNTLALPPWAPDQAAAQRRQLLITSGMCLLTLVLSLAITLSGRLIKTDTGASSSPPLTLPVTQETSSDAVKNASSLPMMSESSSQDNPPKKTQEEPGQRVTLIRDKLYEEKLNKETSRASLAKANQPLTTPTAAKSTVSPVAKTVEDANAHQKQENAVGTRAQTIKVVLQVEDGRVSQAYVANHRPGLEAYEALALRIARQRRYPFTQRGQETVSITLNPPK